MARVEVRITVVCADQAERDAIKQEMESDGTVANFDTVTTPTATTIELDRDDTLALVDGALDYTRGIA
jgi:hypothetical protein